MVGKLASTWAVGGWVLAWALLGAAPAQAHNFVGAQACASCHPFEYRVWSQGPHARAHLSLTEQQSSDTRCTSCHTMAPGDEAAASPVDTLILHEPGAAKSALPPAPATVASAQDSHLAGVQCESCHGAGKLYQPEYVMRDKELARLVGLVDPTPASCQGCHTDGAPGLAPFDYKTLWGRIDHGRQARLLYEQELAQKAAASAPPTPAVRVPDASPSRRVTPPSGSRRPRPAAQPGPHRAR